MPFHRRKKHGKPYKNCRNEEASGCRSVARTEGSENDREGTVFGINRNDGLAGFSKFFRRLFGFGSFPGDQSCPSGKVRVEKAVWFSVQPREVTLDSDNAQNRLNTQSRKFRFSAALHQQEQ